MSEWPNAPPHRLLVPGTYFVTAGTYQRQHYLNSPEKLSFVMRTLFEVVEEFDWKLEAWAVLVNHYHIVGSCVRNPESLSRMLNKLHSVTAREINRLDNVRGRKVWYNFRETKLTYETSYFARLKYVHTNPVHHGVAASAAMYRWCSAAWFEHHADQAFVKKIFNFKIDDLNIDDDF